MRAATAAGILGALVVIGGCVVLPATATSGPAVHVVGNQLVDGSGAATQLRGVNIEGPEYACSGQHTIFDGPTNTQAQVTLMKAWAVNAVRIPLNEDYWLGINRAPVSCSGANYVDAIRAYVDLLNQNGLVAILDLQESAPGTKLPGSTQSPLADQDHSPAFWTSVASTFKAYPSVIFDVFNEPFAKGNSNDHDQTFWNCIRDGGGCGGAGYQVAGEQELINGIRAVGALQPIMISGPEYAGVLDHWLATGFADPQSGPAQLIASVHTYGLRIDSPGRVPSARDADEDATIAAVPVVAGEFGDGNCTTQFSPGYMTWADAHGVSYLAWAWGPPTKSTTAGGPCGSGGPQLLHDWSGTPTVYGQAVRDHLVGHG